MKFESGRYDELLKPLRKRFLTGVLLLFIITLLCVYQERTKQLLNKTHKELLRAQDGMSRVKQAIVNRKQALAVFRSQLEKVDDAVSTARIVYSKVDEINAAYRPDEITIGSIEKKGTDVTLSYTLKFVDMDYNRFLTIINELQRGTYPVSQVTSLSIVQSALGGKGAISYSISGILAVIEKVKP